MYMYVPQLHVLGITTYAKQFMNVSLHDITNTLNRIDKGNKVWNDHTRK